MLKKPVFTWCAITVVLILLAASFLIGCGDEQGEGPGPSEILVVSTTDTRDSGLFDVLLPAFERAYPQYRVRVNAVGTGEALKLGEKCDADVMLVHEPAAEKEFVAGGFGTERREVMYNEFLIVGPLGDPAGVETAPDAATAFNQIAQTRSDFVSRGDDSGTYRAEKKLWEKGGVLIPSGVWYKSTGQGMGETLRIAAETESYTLADLGTWLSMKSKLSGIAVLFEGGEDLLNQYGVIPVNPEKCSEVNTAGAADFAGWLVSAEGQKAIGDYGVEQYGRSLFTPDAD